MSNENRIGILDSVRGLAALTVLFNHMLQTFPLFDAPYAGTFFDTYHEPTWSSTIAFMLSYTPLHLVWGGHEAVILFFILSGFVLSLSYLGDTASQPYAAFLIKRIFRIYIPYITVIAVSGMIISMLTIHPIPQLSDFFNVFWANPIDWRRIVDHILMLGLTTADIDGVTWSLVHEMRISLIFPFLMLLIAKKGWKTSLVLAAACSAAAELLHAFYPLRINIYGTVHYTSFFIIGAVLAKYRNSIKGFYIRLNTSQKVMLVLVTVFFFNWRWEFSIVPYLNNFKITEWGIALGAALALVISLNSQFAIKFLSRRIILWLGQISFSLYLVHLVILLTMVHLLHNTLPIPVIMAMVPFISLAVAAAVYRWVEVPAIALGKKCSSAVKKKDVPNIELAS